MRFGQNDAARVAPKGPRGEALLRNCPTRNEASRRGPTRQRSKLQVRRAVRTWHGADMSDLDLSSNQVLKRRADPFTAALFGFFRCGVPCQGASGVRWR